MEDVSTNVYLINALGFLFNLQSERDIQLMGKEAYGDKVGFEIGEGKVSLVSMNSKGSGIDFEFTPTKVTSNLSDEDEKDFMMTTLLCSIEEFYNKISEVLDYKNPKYIEHMTNLRKNDGSYNNSNGGNKNRTYQDSSDDDSYEV